MLEMAPKAFGRNKPSREGARDPPCRRLMVAFDLLLQKDVLLGWLGRRSFGRGGLVESAALQERGHIRVASGEVTEQLQRFVAPAAREKRLPEAIAILAFQAAMLLEPFHAVGVEHFTPEVGIVTGGITARERMGEISRAITRRHWRVV